MYCFSEFEIVTVEHYQLLVLDMNSFLMASSIEQEYTSKVVCYRQLLDSQVFEIWWYTRIIIGVGWVECAFHYLTPVAEAGDVCTYVSSKSKQ